MKKIKGILFILFIFLLVIASSIYIDYFIVRSRNTTPKIALKKNLDDNLIVYNAVFYRVWYCKTNNKYTIGNYDDLDAICPKKYNYDNGEYVNSKGITITKKDLSLISEIYNSSVIELIEDKETLNDYVEVALGYGKIKYKNLKVNNVDVKSSDGNNIIVFPEYNENEDGEYEWIYNEEVKYCLKNNQIAPYVNNKCGKYTSIKMKQKWCETYKKSSDLLRNDDMKLLCQEQESQI